MYLTKALAILGISGSLVFAVEPLGKVTVSDGLQINRKLVPPHTAPTWPVAVNDEVATAAKPAVLMIVKNDRAEMATQTSLKLEQQNGSPILNLVLGSVCLRMTRESTMQVVAYGEQLTLPHPFQGSITLDAQHKPSIKRGRCGFPVVPVVAGTAAGAAAAAAGAAVVSASPSQ